MKKVRIQLDFEPSAARRLDEQVKELGAASRAEVVRRALCLLDRVNQHNGTIILRQKDGREVEIMFF